MWCIDITAKPSHCNKTVVKTITQSFGFYFVGVKPHATQAVLLPFYTRALDQPCP